MKLLRLFAVLALLCAFAGAPALVLAQPVPATQTTVIPTPAPSAGTTITTTAPVSSDTTISIGTIAGQALSWMLTVLAPVIGGFLVNLLYKMATRVGITMDDQRRARLQEIVVNGLHAAAANLVRTIDGKVPVHLKGELVTATVHYVQDHGMETLKALGFDPEAPETVVAIQARIERALADPAVPVAIGPPAPTSFSTVKPL